MTQPQMKVQKFLHVLNPTVSNEPDRRRFGDFARLLKYPVGSEPKLLWPAIIYAGIIIGLQVISPETRILSFTGLFALAAFRGADLFKRFRLLFLRLLQTAGWLRRHRRYLC